MFKFGYQLSYSAWDPVNLIDHAQYAEKAGFDFIFNEDHFHPYLRRNTCANAWVTMPIILQETKRAKVGPMVTTTLGGRYHPAVIAQATATLDYIFPGRIILGLGTGEEMQTVPLGSNFPKYPERLRNLRETVEIIKKLWKEDFVDYNGKYWSLRSAKLYTKPKEKIPILIAAHGPRTAELAGEYADFVDVEPVEDYLKKEIFPAIRRGAEKVGRNPDDIKICGRLFVSIDEEYEKAFNSAKEYALGHYGIYHCRGFFDPRKLEEYEKEIESEINDPNSEHYKFFCITTEAEDIIRKLEKIGNMGVNVFFILNPSPNPIYAINIFRNEIIPYFKQKLP
jgi:coenzyme F420-dependent glucose-6-phosphate dehydrogenase